MKKFKILSLVLAIVMLLGLLVGCGSTKYNFYTTIKSVKDIEHFDYNANFTIKMSDANDESQNINLDLKISGHYEDEKHFSMSIDGKLPNASETRKITDVFIVDDMAYINVKSLIDTVSYFYGSNDASPQLSGDYYAIDLKNALESNTNGEISIENSDVYETVAKDFIDICTDFFETATKDTDVIKSEGSKHTLTISDKNITKLINNFGDALDKDFEKTVDELITKYEKSGEKYAEIVSELKEFKKSGIKDAKDTISQMKSFKYESDIQFNGTLSIELTGKNGSRKFVSSLTCNMYEKTDSTDKSFDVSSYFTINEGSSDIKAPTSIISQDELQSILGGLSIEDLLGGFSATDETVGIGSDPYDFEVLDARDIMYTTIS